MMESVLLAHFARYPKMTPQDAVKLLYQSAFGPGHLIRDEAMARTRLAEELAATPAHDGPLLEVIGGGYARLYLGAAKAQKLSTDEIFSRFLTAAQGECSGKLAFEAGIRSLQALTEQGRAPFDAQALAAYLTDYRAAGCPMVSHSPVYREHYHPAYRVVLQPCAFHEKSLCSR